MITPFVFVLLLVFGMPFARALAKRLEGSGAIRGDELLALRRLLEAAEQRAQDADQRVNQLEERVDFLEKLLQAPRQGGALPPE
ncbi:MAG: hypothetical protein IRZ00_20855 [Gemmatimonadetes bacterium]|nr:hypothetical protein [Gemmatimonadota bacterium]